MLDRLQNRAKALREGRASDKGALSTELIVILVVLAIIGTVGVILYFTMSGNAHENNAQAVGAQTQASVQAFYGDYGSLPADEDALDAYLEASGDEPVDEALPEDTDLTVYDSTVGPPSAVVVVVESEQFSDVIVINRGGSVTKVPAADFDLDDLDVETTPLLEYSTS